MMDRNRIDYIETNLDPDGIIREDVNRGLLMGVEEYAETVVTGLDEAFADESGSGTTVEEITEYVHWLMDLETKATENN